MQSLLSFLGINNLIPHGYCLTWDSSLLWLTVVSDALIALAYYSIPLTLLYFVRKRRDLPYPQLFTMFSLFIVACGTTHLFSILTIWIPVYWFEAIVKAVTALVSVFTALLMFKIVPLALLLKSPSELEHEIQEKTEAQTALQEVLTRLQAIASCLPGVVFQLIQRPDGSSYFPYASDAIQRIFCVSPEEVKTDGAIVFDTIHPDDRCRVIDSMTHSAANLTPCKIEYRVNLANQHIRWLLIDAFPQIEVDGSVCWHGFITDITDRKKNEEALRIAAITFESNEAILITDADANIIRVNRAFEEITGYSSEEVIGKNPSMLSSGLQNAEFYKGMWAQLIKTGTWQGEIWDRRKNGQLYPKWLSITALKTAQGKISQYIGLFSDITDYKQAEEKIHNLAFYDALTNLPNRRLLLDRFNQALAAAERSQQYGAILFLDMDKFKTLNDTLGHQAGDQMLIEVAERLKSSVRKMDTVTRFGGDEFIVILEKMGSHVEQVTPKVMLIAEKVRSTLAKPYYIANHTHHSSPSIGVCLFRDQRVSVDDLIKYADIAMYQAKNAGRNTIRFYDPVLQEAVQSRLNLESDLRNALLNQEFQLYYQTQFDQNYLPFSAEALIRWHHPEHGIICPAQFIPIAEETHLILEIGQWVLESACQQLEKWGKNDVTKNLMLSINVSAHQFMLPHFVTIVEKAINSYQFDSSKLKLELTESVLVKDVQEIVAKMHALKNLGIKLSLDDFGTGYSSLSYLKQLPLDQIKIDQSFVRDIITDPNDAIIVKTIIDMAKNFHLNVIAEGVETTAQHEYLQQHGCMEYQGYLFGKPMPLIQFEAILIKIYSKS